MKLSTSRAVQAKVAGDYRRNHPARAIKSITGYNTATVTSIYIRTDKYSLTFTFPRKDLEAMHIEEYEELIRSLF